MLANFIIVLKINILTLKIFKLYNFSKNTKHVHTREQKEYASFYLLSSS